MISHVVSESELVALTNVSRKVQPKILLESVNVSENTSVYPDIKKNVHYTRGITPRRVTSGGAHSRVF